MQTLTITLPTPHSAQARIIDEAGRFNVVDCGRRFGKTTLGIDRALAPDVLAHPVGWFSPTYKDLLEVWREVDIVTKAMQKRRSVQERRLEYITGGVTEFWSLDDPDAGRGRKYRRIIVDEAAKVARLLDIWYLTLRPTLADYAGDAWFLSSPRGRNGFWTMYQWGEDDGHEDWRCWKMPTGRNPFINEAEIEAMRLEMPEDRFRQEILADFVDDQGGVFRRVKAAATAEPQDERQLDADGRWQDYVFGVDWGQQNDFTAIAVIDVAAQALVRLDRFRQIDYVVQSNRLRALHERFLPAVILAEANSMGQPIIDRIRRDGLPVQPFTTTNATKAAAIDALALAFERGDIRIIDDPVLVGELQAYEMSKTATGLRKFSAPDGMHDDTVIALALAWQAASRTPAPMIKQPEQRSRWDAVRPQRNGGGRWSKF